MNYRNYFILLFVLLIIVNHIALSSASDQTSTRVVVLTFTLIILAIHLPHGESKINNNINDTANNNNNDTANNNKMINCKYAKSIKKKCCLKKSDRKHKKNTCKKVISKCRPNICNIKKCRTRYKDKPISDFDMTRENMCRYLYTGCSDFCDPDLSIYKDCQRDCIDLYKNCFNN